MPYRRRFGDVHQRVSVANTSVYEVVISSAQEVVDVDNAIAAKTLPAFVLSHEQALLKAVEVHHAKIVRVCGLQVTCDVAAEQPIALNAVRACAVALAQLHVVFEQIGQAGASNRSVSRHVSRPRLSKGLRFLFGSRIRKPLIRANCLAVDAASKVQTALENAIRTALDLNAHHDHSQFSRIREGQLSSWQSAQSNGSFLMLNSTIRYFRENRMSSSRA